MKPLEEQDHYELLEISPQARAEEIEGAYQMARSIYADESMAGRSVFEAGDAPRSRRDRRAGGGPARRHRLCPRRLGDGAPGDDAQGSVADE